MRFWFGAPPWAVRAAWFRKSDAFDAEIRDRFGCAIEAALHERPAGSKQDRDAWGAAPLAEILLLDQFTRNVFRGTPRAFAGDARALALAQALVANGADRALHPLQRWFAYLPFEHAEDRGLQDTSLRLFRSLVEDHPSLAGAPGDAPYSVPAGGLAGTLAGALDYAERHHAVVARFGRFPHRNRVLGRPNSADELAYLAQPGAGF